jgi:hypothetical protein
MLPQSSGLKCTGSRIGFVVLACYKEDGHETQVEKVKIGTQFQPMESGTIYSLYI